MSISKIFESQPFLITANVLSGILSVVVIGLTADNLVYVHTPGAKDGLTLIKYNMTMHGDTMTQRADIALLPVDIRLGSYWLLLAAGIGGFLDSILLGGMMCWRRLKAAEMQAEKKAVGYIHYSAPHHVLICTTDHRSKSHTTNSSKHLYRRRCILSCAGSNHLLFYGLVQIGNF